MRGYTSYGTGASGVPVRLFSRPEIIVHRLDS
jgi:predicted MPP superfamily phosphohydrolase